ncbi:MAG: ComEC/Rec2 family competence protein [Bacteroidota bacterium]
MIGILTGYYTSPPIKWILSVTCIIIILSIYLYSLDNRRLQPSLIFTFSVFLLFTFVGILSFIIHADSQKDKYFANHLKEKNHTVLQIDKVLKPSDFYQKFEANIQQINQQKVIGKILLNVKKDSIQKDLKVDDVLLTTSEIKKIQKPLNPFQFDYRNYLHKRQIDYQLNINSNDFLTLNRSLKTVKGLAFLIREKINQNLKKYNFTPNELAVINAILLGQRQDLSRELYKDYQRAGAVHILAVSGLHIGIILLLLQILLKPLERIKNGRIVRLILLIILLWAYAFLAGLSASVVRAVSMFSAVAFGMFLGRSTHVKNALVISMFFLLLFNPYFLFDVGFQLSYAAVFSIVIFQPLISKLMYSKNKILQYFWQLFTVTLAAQIGVLPLSLYYFHQFPGLFLVSSLVIIPLLGIILGFGFLIILLASSEILPQFIADTYNFIIQTLNKFVVFISHQETFLIRDIFFPHTFLVIVYLILISGFYLMKNQKPKNLIYFFISIIILQTTMIYNKKQLLNSNEFIVFHQIKNTILTIRKGKNTNLYQSRNSSNKYLKSTLRNELGYIKIKQKKLKNILDIHGKKMLIIDSTVIYSELNFYPKIVLLRQSPKINFERMLLQIKPQTIIADGSNYKSYIRKWKKTSGIYQVNFHDTSEKGAFIYKFDKFAD